MSFRKHASGLLVPEEHSRAREVWTRDEWRLLDRATKMLDRKGLRVYLGCATMPECRNQPIERVRMPDGGITLRCAHLDRIVYRQDPT